MTADPGRAQIAHLFELFEISPSIVEMLELDPSVDELRQEFGPVEPQRVGCERIEQQLLGGTVVALLAAKAGQPWQRWIAV